MDNRAVSGLQRCMRASRGRNSTCCLTNTEEGRGRTGDPTLFLALVAKGGRGPGDGVRRGPERKSTGRKRSRVRGSASNTKVTRKKYCEVRGKLVSSRASRGGHPRRRGRKH